MKYDTYDEIFETVSILGQGAFGIVTHSIRKKDGKSFAVKEININKLQYPEDEIIKMVQNEISYLIQLSYKPCNPNIVCYYDMFRDIINNSFYIVMEYIQGQNLMQTINTVRANNINDGG